jgi:hypothetical protein
VVFYANMTVLTQYSDGLTVYRNKYPNLWLAYYGTEEFNVWGDPSTVYGRPEIPAGWNLWGWQYTQHGRVPGYTSDLDLSIIYGGDDVALSDDDIKRILNFPAFDPTPDQPKPPTVSAVLLHAEQVYRALFVGGDSTPVKGQSLVEYWKAQTATATDIKVKVTAIDTNVKALPEKLGTGSVTPAAPPALDAQYTLELKKVQ